MELRNPQSVTLYTTEAEENARLRQLGLDEAKIDKIYLILGHHQHAAIGAFIASHFLGDPEVGDSWTAAEMVDAIRRNSDPVMMQAVLVDCYGINCPAVFVTDLDYILYVATRLLLNSAEDVLEAIPYTSTIEI